MAGLNKMFKSFKNEHVLGTIGLLVLLFALYKYSENKNLFRAGYNNARPLNPDQLKQAPASGSVTPSSSSTTYAPYNGASSSTVSNSATPPASMNKPIANPSDLLPSDSNSSWSALNPVGDLKNVNLLNPSQMVGINTQGSSLRNANLQLRSEPANPRTNTTGPWNQTTIDADTTRKQLEIGA